ncbi:Uncharacterised protein [Providencia rettgeri]|uniref:Uncharacterized protein n=1 Tax=Providencia rettgeri TaxID=587 RepID=A0A9N8D187_PRORE|nr:Uncharacterised protein [Providencia rettgeri]CAB5704713.1 Uncharacterised protein [Providencia rettgeri]CAC9189990.1 Uncharacterised protein [Providencia rettgeri]CAC9223351.1 Uncharacterised protein [Providencia rettgeri]
MLIIIKLIINSAVFTCFTNKLTQMSESKY